MASQNRGITKQLLLWMHEWADRAEGTWKRNIGNSQSVSRNGPDLSELLDSVCEQGGVVQGFIPPTASWWSSAPRSRSKTRHCGRATRRSPSCGGLRPPATNLRKVKNRLRPTASADRIAPTVMGKV